MTLVTRTLRNLWHDVEGIFTKYVNEDDADLDAVDFTDELETNQAISSAAFEGVTGVTLGTPSISAGVVSFTHTGAGSAVLQVVLDFAAYIASLYTMYLSVQSTPVGAYSVIVVSDTGLGASAGGAVTLQFILGGDTLSNIDIEYATIVGYAGGVFDVEAISYNTGTQLYEGILVDDLAAEDDDQIATSVKAYPDTENVALEALYSAKPTRTLHRKLAFTDPSSPDTDYTP